VLVACIRFCAMHRHVPCHGISDASTKNRMPLLYWVCADRRMGLARVSQSCYSRFDRAMKIHHRRHCHRHRQRPMRLQGHLSMRFRLRRKLQHCCPCFPNFSLHTLCEACDRCASSAHCLVSERPRGIINNPSPGALADGHRRARTRRRPPHCGVCRACASNPTALQLQQASGSQ
jgi:hypothetical protein